MIGYLIVTALRLCKEVLNNSNFVILTLKESLVAILKGVSI